MPCKHAALALIYAKQMAEMDEPWKLWEDKDARGGSWHKLTSHPDWSSHCNYRQIPKTISINGIDVPEPMREKPEIGTEYFTVDLIREGGYGNSKWRDDCYDNRWLKLGICHLTRENCIIHAKALFSFSESKE